MVFGNHCIYTTGRKSKILLFFFTVTLRIRVQDFFEWTNYLNETKDSSTQHFYM